MPKLKPRKTFGVSRIDQVTTHTRGFYVRVGGERRFFSDVAHGGRAKALKAAEAHRNALFETLPDNLKSRASRPRKNI